jgi:hypothetical protein
MSLLCLKCESARCTCGRLALVHLGGQLRDEDVIGAASKPVLGLIDCAGKRGDASAELERLFVQKLRHDDGSLTPVAE